MRVPKQGHPHECPWRQQPTHGHNRMLRVHKERPVVLGYCALDKGCTSCAGTGLKPNFELGSQGEWLNIPCPCCMPQEYDRVVRTLCQTLPRMPQPLSGHD